MGRLGPILRLWQGIILRIALSVANSYMGREWRTLDEYSDDIRVLPGGKVVGATLPSSDYTVEQTINTLRGRSNKEERFAHFKACLRQPLAVEPIDVTPGRWNELMAHPHT